VAKDEDEYDTTYTMTYVQLKKDRKRKQKEVLEVTKQEDINMFTVIKSHENHDMINDEHSKTLGYLS
jgi:hypothetical protein